MHYIPFTRAIGVDLGLNVSKSIRQGAAGTNYLLTILRGNFSFCLYCTFRPNRWALANTFFLKFPYKTVIFKKGEICSSEKALMSLKGNRKLHKKLLSNNSSKTAWKTRVTVIIDVFWNSKHSALWSSISIEFIMPYMELFVPKLDQMHLVLLFQKRLMSYV